MGDVKLAMPPGHDTPAYFTRRITQLSSELDHGMQKWEAKRKKREEDQEEKRRKRLQPKGDSLQQLPK
ncbi:PREDICTED: 39S ribosomal protein L52, mitochondrial [Thamnophis sirtalis]|uniref:39S ribosomal protein L52, mitochondrial n=1 Tax=Thamnophis sirtalis TaxID=35019 RepID=A0A6I9YHW5_9SAUR|nr:PREDICTED: 39S ribosomal protein L52, mitochondrial [Thamnophis sirtalis]